MSEADGSGSCSNRPFQPSPGRFLIPWDKLRPTEIEKVFAEQRVCERAETFQVLEAISNKLPPQQTTVGAATGALLTRPWPKVFRACRALKNSCKFEVKSNWFSPFARRDCRSLKRRKKCKHKNRRQIRKVGRFFATSFSVRSLLPALPVAP